jgi:uncharacterized protein YciI
MRTLLLLAFLAAVPSCFASCAAAPRAPRDEAPARSWVWIVTGPRDADVQGEARSAAFAGHFANMGRMAEAGEMLVAGPFGEPRARDDHRGVFVLATSDLAEAQRVADSDPTAQAGVFRFEIEPFTCAAPLERLTAMHAAATADVENPPPGYHCRPYVLVAGAPAAAAEMALASTPVLFRGRIGAGANERALACLDAQTADEAHALVTSEDVAWTVMPWFATEEIANLR